jgi:phage gpG-like protein
MKEFESLGEFAAFLEKAVAQYEPVKKSALEVIGQNIEDSAKRKFGVYQLEDGPFDAWAPLAESTMEDRVRKGFSPDDPLFRTGELMDSIGHKVQGDDVVIGSDSDIMIYQELGTETIPPRPVLAPAMYEERKHIKASIDELLRAFILNDKPKLKKF